MSYPVSKPPIKKSSSSAGLWKLEDTTSESLAGYRFAATIAALASGASIDKIAPKPKSHHVKKVFWEEPRFNPPIAYGHIDYAIDAHITLTKANWKRGGKKFRTGLRFEVEREVLGPLIPEEHRQFFEKPTKTFGRRRELNHLDVARAYNKPAERFNDTCVVEKNRKDQRTALIGPLTYKLPDLWSETNGISSRSPSRKSSLFSGSTRFKDQMSVYTPYLVEKAGTSIPFSRGHHQNTGEGSLFESSLSSDVKEGDRAGSRQQQSAVAHPDSLTTWDTYEESNPGKLAHLQAFSTIDNDADRAQSAAQLQPTSVDPTHRASPLKEFRVQTPAAAKGSGKSKSPSRSSVQLARSHKPGFSFSTKTEEHVKGADDASKVYKRIKLPDGTPVIVPLFVAHGVDTHHHPTTPMMPLGAGSLASLGVEQSIASLDNQFDSLQVSGSQINAHRPYSVISDEQRSVVSTHSFGESLMDSNSQGGSKTDSNNDITRITLSSMPPKPLTPKMYRNRSKLIRRGLSSFDLGLIEPYHRNIIDRWKTPLFYSSKKLNVVPDVGGVLVRAGKERRRKTAGDIDAQQQSHLSSYSYNILKSQQDSCLDPDDAIPHASAKTVLDGKSDKTVLSPPLSRNESPLLSGNIRGDNEMSSLVFDDAISLNSYSTR